MGRRPAPNRPGTGVVVAEVHYGDPGLELTESTGPLRVVGRVAEVATGPFGLRALLVDASRVTL